MTTKGHYKDARLDELSNRGNVAQFVSFSPELKVRFSRVRGFEPNTRFVTIADAVGALLGHSPEGKVNVRSFRPDDPQGHEFIYSLRSIEDTERHVRRLGNSGLYVIVNETVDVNDGGVSGVAHGNVIEFAPGATPRVVETGLAASLNRTIGEHLLGIVYGIVPEIPSKSGVRIEFSIHPTPRGFRNQRTIIWEIEDASDQDLHPSLTWPNKFSEFIGDKTFGLLVADSLGLRVPHTTVLSRNVAPFSFGEATGSSVTWLRTAPRVAEPGFFPTVRGWTDPFTLVEQVPGSERIAAVLIQHEVSSRYSGALLTASDGSPIIEGVEGFGDDFMLGRVGASRLRSDLENMLKEVHSKLQQTMGSLRAEWAFDGESVWLLQLQQEVAMSSGLVIVPGEVVEEFNFDVSGGVSGLRELVSLIGGRKIGIALQGNVGMTSHIADILRRHKIPSRIVPAPMRA